MTLTLADSELSLSDGISKLLTSFRKLRNARRWKDNVEGGVAFIETKWNAKLNRWHPHVHAIMEADYLPQSWLSAEWQRITETSFVVHIKRPPSIETVIRYVTKYGSKPLDQSFVADEDRLDEAIAALKGRHLCLAFGSWRGWALNDEDEEGTWETVDTLVHLIARSKAGDAEALAILKELQCISTTATTNQSTSRAPPDDVPF